MTSKKLILLVDSCPVGAQMSRTLLSALGHEVVVARTGKAALSSAAEAPFDIILLEKSLQDMDGSACAKALGEMSHGNRRFPIVLYTKEPLNGEAKDPAFVFASQRASALSHLSAIIQDFSL